MVKICVLFFSGILLFTPLVRVSAQVNGAEKPKKNYWFQFQACQTSPRGQSAAVSFNHEVNDWYLGLTFFGMREGRLLRTPEGEIKQGAGLALKLGYLHHFNSWFFFNAFLSGGPSQLTVPTPHVHEPLRYLVRYGGMYQVEFVFHNAAFGFGPCFGLAQVGNMAVGQFGLSLYLGSFQTKSAKR